MYENATVFRGGVAGEVLIAHWFTPDPRGDVAAFYKEALAQPPWQIQAVDDNTVSRVTGIQFTRRDYPSTRSVVILEDINRDGNRTSIYVSMTAVP